MFVANILHPNMARFLTLVIVFLSPLFLPTLSAQKYILPVYTATVERDVMYGTAIRFNGVTDTLRMNIWKPVGDTSVSRPIFLWIHGGGFTEGNRTSMDATCAELAQRGYVAATMSYRLGFYTQAGLGYPFSFDSSEVIRASIRGVQDARGAMRYLVSRSAKDSSNPKAFFIGGASAGAIIALQATYGTQTSDIPEQIGTISPITREQFTYTRENLGNYYGELYTDIATPTPVACVNLLGGVWQLHTFHGKLDIPLFSYHQTEDPVVPCSYRRGLWGLPFDVARTYPNIYGSCSITEYLQEIATPATVYTSQLISGGNHDIADVAKLERDIIIFCAEKAATITSIQDDSQEGDVARFSILDITGREIFVGNATLRSARIEVSRLPTAVYILRFGQTTEFLYSL